MATKVKKCCDKERDRRKLIQAALASAWFESDEERKSAVESYSKSTLTLEEILMLTKGLRDITRNATKTKSRIFGSNSRVISGIA
jgi:hypothetical protein